MLVDSGILRARVTSPLSNPASNATRTRRSVSAKRIAYAPGRAGAGTERRDEKNWHVAHSVGRLNALADCMAAPPSGLAARIQLLWR